MVTPFVHAQTELDSLWSNCCIMHYTNRECDVSPYCDDYAPIIKVPTLQAATAYKVNMQD